MSKTAQEEGRAFEREFAARHGLTAVIASGALWFRKLDVEGFAARWSLKLTTKKSFPLNYDDLKEAEFVCEGPGGTSETPLWAVAFGDINDSSRNEVYILMREKDWEQMATEQVSYRRESKSESKRRQSAVPQLLRSENPSIEG